MVSRTGFQITQNSEVNLYLHYLQNCFIKISLHLSEQIQMVSNKQVELLKSFTNLQRVFRPMFYTFLIHLLIMLQQRRFRTNEPSSVHRVLHKEYGNGTKKHITVVV